MKKLLPIGIDIGTCAVKMVQLAVDGHGYSVVACAKAELPDPEGLTREAKQEALVARVRGKLKEHRFRSNDCISALTDSEVTIKNMRIPASERDRDAAVRNEARSKLPFDVDEAIVNYSVAGEIRHGEDARLEVILFAAREEDVERHVGRLHEMGLVPASVDVQQCALFRTFERYLRRKEDEDEINCFVDLGGITKVVISRGRHILFIKNIDKGALCFNAAVASRLGMELSEAKALRRRLGGAGEKKDVDPGIRQALSDAVRPEVEELADEINKCLRYHSVTFRGSRPGHLTFIGGEAHDGDVPEMLGERLGYKVVIGQPFRGIDTTGLGGDLDRRGMLSEWTTAFGLSLKGAFIQGVGLGYKLAG